MKIVNDFTLINIDDEYSFYMKRFNENTKNQINNNSVLTTIFFTTNIKNSVINLIHDFNHIYYNDNNYFTGKKLFDLLQYQYNLNLNIDYHDFKIIVNMFLNINKILTFDIDLKSIDNLHLYDLKYYNKKSKVNLHLKTINKKDYPILNIIGNDKVYNILLAPYRKDIVSFTKRILLNTKKNNQKIEKFFKQNKYDYQKCKSKVLRKNEKALTKGQKYSHNFKTNDFKNYKNHNNYIDTVVNDLLYYYENKNKFNDNIDKNYFDLIDLYYSKYDLNDLKNDLITLKNHLLLKSENDYNENYRKDLLLTGKKIKCIKLFIDIIDIYEYRITKENIKSDLNQYDNYNYNLKNYFVYHKTKDKI